jgi:exosortase/archaeosortase family protein
VQHGLFALAAIILAYEPVIWLINTWRDPSYDSKGFIVFAVCVAMFIWSISSSKVTCQPARSKSSLLLLAGSAFIRLTGQVLAVNVIGALTLVIDVYAISRLFSLDLRARAISPLWLAVCFAFSLPLERILQRTIGYGLQHISADGACFVLGSIFENVSCYGVRILIDTQDVLVDLPCSGARSFLLLLFFFFICASVGSFRFLNAVAGLLVTIFSAFVVNVLRICSLAACLAYPSLIGGVDVMAQPYHDIIGLLMLALGCLPIIFWARKFSKQPVFPHPVLDQSKWLVPDVIRRDGWWLERRVAPEYKAGVFTAILFIVFAVVTVNLPRKAIDVARVDVPVNLPLVLDNKFAEIIPLTGQEKAYFTQYGGFAQKASYGDHNLMVVRTSSPLRHLHAPDECLRGLGMKVEYKGPQYSPIPAAIYKATDTNGEEYRIAVSFISSEGERVTTNVSEAIWHWMQGSAPVWSAVQRISRWDADADDLARFDYAVMSALEIGTGINKPIQLATLNGDFR